MIPPTGMILAIPPLTKQICQDGGPESDLRGWGGHRRKSGRWKQKNRSVKFGFKPGEFCKISGIWVFWNSIWIKLRFFPRKHWTNQLVWKKKQPRTRHILIGTKSYYHQSDFISTNKKKHTRNQPGWRWIEWGKTVGGAQKTWPWFLVVQKIVGSQEEVEFSFLSFFFSQATFDFLSTLSSVGW